MNKFKFFIYAFIRIPSTFLHESLHAIGVLIFSISDVFFNLIRGSFSLPKKHVVEITSFNLIPDFKSQVLGSVSYINSSPIQSIFISAMPILSWYFLFITYKYLGIISFNQTGISIEFSQLSLTSSMLLVPISIYFAWSGTLSRADINNIFRGFFSAQVLSLLPIIVAFYLLKDYSRSELFDLLNSFMRTSVNWFYSNFSSN